MEYRKAGLDGEIPRRRQTEGDQGCRGFAKSEDVGDVWMVK
jgi:hypothetical protein